MERFRPSKEEKPVDLGDYRDLRKSGFDPGDALDYLRTADKLKDVAWFEKNKPPDDAA